MKVLLIEDNQRLVERINHKLRHWFTIESVESGHAALEAVTSSTYDTLLLDINLPDINGLEVCRKIRDMAIDVPILVVSGESGAQTKTALLDAGADDYMTKPFELSEMRARIDALLRRRHRLPSSDIYEAKDLIVNIAKRTVSRGGTEIILRKKEFDILTYLVIHKGRVLTRESILNYAWGNNKPAWVGSVDVHIKYIRDKVERPFDSPVIRTVYAIGYTIDD